MTTPNALPTQYGWVLKSASQGGLYAAFETAGPDPVLVTTAALTGPDLPTVLRGLADEIEHSERQPEPRT